MLNPCKLIGFERGNKSIVSKSEPLLKQGSLFESSYGYQQRSRKLFFYLKLNKTLPNLTESYILEYFIPSTKTKSLDWVKINYTAIIYEVNMQLKLTKIFKKVPEGYVGFVQELPGANTQAETLEEARENLEEAIELVLESNRLLAEEQLQGQDVIREPIFLSVA